jgi:flagellar biosynthesis/type III secretory pathway protein FliH
MADLLPIYSYALGGIKLKVHPHDLEIVKEILSKLDTDNHLKIV